MKKMQASLSIVKFTLSGTILWWSASCNKEVSYDLGLKPKKAPATASQSDQVKPSQSPSAPPEQPSVVTTQTAGPVQAILSGLPPATHDLSKLQIAVSGQGIQEYQYALLANASTCQTAVFSEWRPINRMIDDTLTYLGNTMVCVKGRTNPTNPQTNATHHSWLQVAPPKLQATLSNVPNDGNLSENLNVIVGGLGVTQYTYVLLEGASTCPSNAAQPSATWKDVTFHIVDAVKTSGKRTLCVAGRNAAGLPQTDYTIHEWTQGQKQEAPKTDPTPENVRIDLENINFESWNKVCLLISANGGPFEKMGCNKQDSEKVKTFLEFKAGESKCAALDFRLEVYRFVKSCAGLADLSTCETSPIADPVRSTNLAEDKPFFVALGANTITLEELEKNSIDISELTSEKANQAIEAASAWLKGSPGRQWVRLYIEDQTNAQMTAFKADKNASLHGIDFDDYVLDIRAIDVGFRIPGLSIDCPSTK